MNNAQEEDSLSGDDHRSLHILLGFLVAVILHYLLPALIGGKPIVVVILQYLLPVLMGSTRSDDNRSTDDDPSDDGGWEEEEEDGDRRVSTYGETSLPEIRHVRQEALQSCKDILELLEQASQECYESCAVYYNTIIVQISQESTRQTLESIVKVKTSLADQEEREERLTEDEAADLANIVTAVRVFSDRQDVLRSTLNDCFEKFKTAQRDYDTKKAQLTEKLLVLDETLSELKNRRMRTGGWPTLEEDDDADGGTYTGARWLSEEVHRMDRMLQTQLRSLRKDYTNNQPPLPVILS